MKNQNYLKQSLNSSKLKSITSSPTHSRIGDLKEIRCLPSQSSRIFHQDFAKSDGASLGNVRYSMASSNFQNAPESERKHTSKLRKPEPVAVQAVPVTSHSSQLGKKKKKQW
jgi:hypothetical protein